MTPIGAILICFDRQATGCDCHHCRSHRAAEKITAKVTAEVEAIIAAGNQLAEAIANPTMQKQTEALNQWKEINK